VTETIDRPAAQDTADIRPFGPEPELFTTEVRAAFRSLR
jgi:hypothetical protein